MCVRSVVAAISDKPAMHVVDIRRRCATTPGILYGNTSFSVVTFSGASHIADSQHFDVFDDV